MTAIKLFGLGASQPQAQAIAAALGLPLSAHEERVFEDGEHKSRPLESVRGADVYVLHSLYADAEQSADDKLCRLLFFLSGLRDHGARRLTAIVPYLCYSRKDRRSQAFDPVTTRYIGRLFEASGMDDILTLDVHNPAAFDNAFHRGTEQVAAHTLFADALAPGLGERDVVVLSPDEGALKRADSLRRALADRLGRGVEIGMMEKRRSGGVVSGETLFADVHERSVVIIDDLISSGTTLLRAARAARAAGASSVVAVASHGLFAENAGDTLADPAIDHILVTDSVPPFRLQGSPTAAKVRVLSAAPLFARAIRQHHPELAA